jgi:hypothetical protein
MTSLPFMGRDQNALERGLHDRDGADFLSLAG